MTATECSRARVVEIDDAELKLVCESVSTCRRCERGEGCGLGLLGPRRPVELTLPKPTDCHATPGDFVLLRCSSRALTRAALSLYGLPLAVFTLSAVGLSLVGRLGDGVVGIVALAAGAVALVVAARRTQHPDWVVEVAAGPDDG